MGGKRENASGWGAISRRRFLSWGLGTGVGLAGLFAGGRVLWRGETPEVPDGLRLLTPREYRTALALAEAHLPPGGAIPRSGVEAGLAEAFDAFLVDEPAANVADLKKALLLINLGPLIFDGSPHPFHSLSLEDRVDHWQGWALSGLALRRQVAIAFRKFFSLVYYDHPAVWPAVGYGGPSFA